MHALSVVSVASPLASGQSAIRPLMAASTPYCSIMSPVPKPSATSRTSLSSESNPRTSMTSPARALAMEWRSVVRSHKVTLEHAAVDIDTDRVLYHMELQLETPLPDHALDNAQFLCLSFPYGGLWRIEKVSENNTKVQCLSWRKTDLTHREVEDLAKRVDTLAKKVEGESAEAEEALLHPEIQGGQEPVQEPVEDDLPTLFEWKMMRGEWGSDLNHWFIRDVEPPALAMQSPPRRQLIAKLLVGFAPLEARIEVNAVTAIDTIEQTYSADVTWQVTLPAITAMREDAVLLELLDLLEIDPHQFEFSNIKEVQSERDMTSSVTPAGQIEFRDLVTSNDHSRERSHVEDVYHLQFSRRVIAVFTEEMALHSFPFDQQKLIFEFTTGNSGMPDGALEMIPTPVEPGCFSVEDFQLGNVFDVAYDNKIFVSAIKESGPKKIVDFEMVLDRKSQYYVTNVALIAAIITYLCFILTWAPVKTSGELMETGTRLQNVTAMLLTAVTFKSQVASLLPQISYFTTLDSYVFFCFIVTALVAVENAMLPLFERYFPKQALDASGKSAYDEGDLLAYSFGLFTLVNITWAMYLRWWIKRRRYAARVLMQVHEYIRVITENIPAKYRVDVLERFLEAKKLEPWCKPKFLVTTSGDIHLLAPDHLPIAGAAKVAKTAKRAERQKNVAKNELSNFQKIYADMRPRLDRHATEPISPASYVIPAARPNAMEYQAGTRHVARMSSSFLNANAGPRSRAISSNAYREDVVVNFESFRRLQAAKTSSGRAI